MKKGKFYGVSTGPGEPELMTLKAVHCIEKVQVIATPRTKGENTMALDIVKAVVDISDKEIVFLDFKMKKDADVLTSSHRQQADQVEEYLSKGQDVAMLNIGDASLFGTYCYIRELVEADGYETETIPGVTSFCAVAAVLGQSLTTMGKPMTIIPGSFGEVDKELDREGTKVIMKSASALPVVRQILEDKGLLSRTSMVANCGLETERVYRDITQAKEDEGYFVTILVKDKDD